MISTSKYVKLPRSFYLRSNVVEIAKDLLGKYLFTAIDGRLTVGMIVETEAYDGRKDRACHAFDRRTPRTDVMYGPGGCAYIYFCYGIHHLFNVVTNKAGLADAVLIRALMPVEGLDIMEERRGGDKGLKLTSGPGSVGQAMGLHSRMSGMDLLGERIWIGRGCELTSPIASDRRVGVDYAQEDAALPWRFFIESSPWVSRGKQEPLSIKISSN